MPNPKRVGYILIIPSSFTTGNLFCGFYSIVRSLNHDFEKASWAIFLAAVFDVLDGRVARITKSNSQFGIEYDSIADVVSFGLAPSMLAYLWVLQDLGRLGFAASFLFACCAALRLARFNSITMELPKSYFFGLPTPAAALFVASLFLFYLEFPLLITNLQPVLLAGLVFISLLMVSNIRYRSFKDFDLKHKRNFFKLVWVVLSLTAIAIKHEVAFVVLLGSYIVWAPLQEALILLKTILFRKKPK